MQQKKPYTLGIDVGVASVGTALLLENEVLGLYVRTFDEGESLNKIRREARSSRRRLHRRTQRLLHLCHLFQRKGLIQRAEPKQFYLTISPWQLRSEGLDRCLNNQEWASVLYHIVNHRGFQSNRKSELRAKDIGKMLSSITTNQQKMKDQAYRSIGEMVWKDTDFKEVKRNKSGSYKNTFARDDLQKELRLLFARQKELDNCHTSDDFCEAVNELLMIRRPALSGDQIEKTIGHCTFEPSELRAAKATHSAERFNWYDKILFKMRVGLTGQQELLTDQQKQQLRDLPFEQTSVSFAQIKKKLNLPEQARCNLVSYTVIKKTAEKTETSQNEIETETAEKTETSQNEIETETAEKTETSQNEIETETAEKTETSQNEIETETAEKTETSQNEIETETAEKTETSQNEIETETAEKSQHTVSKKTKKTRKTATTQEEIKTAEKTQLFAAKAFHELRKAYQEAGLQLQWQIDKNDTQRLDQIATVLTTYREDDYIREKLQSLGIEDEVIEAVLICEFTQFSHLSLKALGNILPFMAEGLGYDKACLKAGYHHSAPSRNTTKIGKIPAPDKNQIRNPVVYRSLNQARKLINAIVTEYGAPVAIHIEMGRDLNKSLNERKEIEEGQEKYRQQKEQLVKQYIEHFGIKPKSLDLLKFGLYKEQVAQCAYSQRTIDLNSLNEVGYVEVDHILPYSRSYDNSENNKALVLTSVNRDKGNCTPFELMGEDENSEHWQKFVNWVKANSNIRETKRNRYLRKDFSAKPEQEFRERHLNDTRHIGRQLKTLIEKHIIWHSQAKGSEQCVVVNGQLTSFLRTRWGFLKDRGANDLHHALDAAVIAATSRSMVQRMANHAKYHELKHVRTGYTDPKTGEIFNPTAARKLEKHFPLPWENFRNDVMAALKSLRVSRRPTRRKFGAAHQDTIRSRGKNDCLLQQGLAAVRTPLTKLTLKNIKDIVGYNDSRNQTLIDAIRQRLEEFDGKGKKAFAKNQIPLYKPSKTGKKAPIVRSVNLLVNKKSGILVRHGIADNAIMIRVDIFSKGGKYFTVPIYVADTIKKQLPNRAVVSNKPEEQWIQIDHTYEFLFSLHQNDWVRVEQKNKIIQGYYSTLNRSSGAINIVEHDRDHNKGKQKDGVHRSVGIKNAKILQKYHVDLLGRLYRVHSEPRLPLRKN